MKAMETPSESMHKHTDENPGWVQETRRNKHENLCSNYRSYGQFFMSSKS